MSASRQPPGTAEPQLGPAPLTSPGNAEPQLGPIPHTPPGTAEPQLGTLLGGAELGLGVPRKPLPGWRTRGYVPHRDEASLSQAITFRLADSLPREQLAALEERLALAPEDTRTRERRRQLDAWLDAGHGCCALRHPAVASLMVETLQRFDRVRYRLIAWCVMPNHVHVLITPSDSLGRIVQSWKSYTGRWILAKNAELGLGVPGPACWMREYWDRYIRDERHFAQCVAYIHDNPVKAGLCRTATAWPWSSAPGSAEPTSPGTAEPQLGPAPHTPPENAEPQLGPVPQSAELGLGVPGKPLPGGRRSEP